MARTKKEIDWEEFDKLCALQCTKLEICDWLGVTDKTLEARCKEKFNHELANDQIEPLFISEYSMSDKRLRKITSFNKLSSMSADKTLCVPIKSENVYANKAGVEAYRLLNNINEMPARCL